MDPVVESPSRSIECMPGSGHKVLHILGGSLFGGATKMVIAICKDLSERGYEVQVLTSDPETAARFAAAGIQVQRQPPIPTSISPVIDPVVAYRLARLCRREQFTVVHTHTSKAGFVGRLSARLAGVPVILHTVHGFAFHESSRASTIRFYGTLEREAARWCERLVFVNEFHRAWAVQMRIAPAAKTLVIPNGLPRLPATRPTGQSSLRAEFALSPDAVVIGAIGRLAPDKRIEDLVEVMPQIIDEFPSAVLLLVGDGPSKESVLAAVQLLRLGDHVVTTGFVSDVDRYYDLVDVVVLPTVREGLSISLLEAMRAGKSIVTTSIGSNRTVVEDDRSALLVPPGSRGALRDAILCLLRNPEYANALGNGARATFESKFTEEAMLERTRSLYAALLRGRDPVPAGSTPLIGPT